MKNYLTIAILFVILALNTRSEEYYFSYDGAGNRVKRSLISAKRINSSDTTVFEKNITIYPNPTNGIITLEIEGLEIDDNSKIVIYDIQGEEVYSKENIDNNLIIDLTDQVSGVYLLDIYINDERSYWKIIKEE